MTDQEVSARILIVEDSLGVAHAFQRALGLYQDGVYQVNTVQSGEAALKQLNEAPFDLLISDLRLPGIDGLELLKRACQIRPGMRTVLITAYGSPEIEARARELAAAYLPKPFRLQELVSLVERILAKPVQVLQPVAEPELSRIGKEEAIGWAVKKNTHLCVLACDLDGTLAENGQISVETQESLKVAKLAGLILILVTGRVLDGFATVFPISELCEAIVAENGSVIYFPRHNRVILPFGHLDPEFLQRLESTGIPLERGMAIAATQAPHSETVMEALKESRSGITVEYNRNAVMMLPPGATKGSGLSIALQELGYSPHNVLACGDGENDRSLFEVAELSVAVANAQPALKTLADNVLSQPNGAGVQMLIKDLLAGRPPGPLTRLDRHLLLGYRKSGAPLHLDPFILVENNLGIFGSSGSGKSWLGGLLAEELLKQRYQICVIDPEGEYRGLGASPHTLQVGGQTRALPPAIDLLNILEWNNISLVLDFSMYPMKERITYLAVFIPMLRGLRSRRGRPHCILVDEIQDFCPTGGGVLTDPFLEAMQLGGFSMISYRLSQIAPAVLADLDHFLVTRLALREELNTLQVHLPHYDIGIANSDQLRTLPKGQACLYLNPAKQLTSRTKGAIRFHVGPRAVPHIRHLHKYLRAPLPEAKRFYFHEPGGRFLARTAASLWDFRQALSEIPLDSLRYHLDRGDFEHWLNDILHDQELARQMHEIANRDPQGEALRRAMLEVVVERYEELETLL